MDSKSLLKLEVPNATLARHTVAGSRTESMEPAIREAMIWCSLQPITAVSPETSDTLRRRGLLVQASGLYVDMQKLPYSEWKHSDIRKRADELHTLADLPSLVLLSHQLRSSALKPPQDMWEHFSQRAVEEAVAHVVSTRSGLLRGNELFSHSRSEAWNRGRLLAYQPHENLADGAAEYSSNGFFDADNCPPWDSWVSYDGSILTSFVPEVLIPLAQAGIDANPEQCIQWASG